MEIVPFNRTLCISSICSGTQKTVEGTLASVLAQLLTVVLILIIGMLEITVNLTIYSKNS